MATEHEFVGGDQNCLYADGNFAMHRGWGDSSSCRYHPVSGWGSWNNVQAPLSTGDGSVTEDGRLFGEPNPSESLPMQSAEDAKDIWDSVSQSPDYCWGEHDKITESPKMSWEKISESAESPKTSWDKISEPVGDGWDELYDPDCGFECPHEPDIGSKCSGLTNLGNTCFMNSVLQCLTYTAPFANRILSSQHRVTCTVQDFCAMCAMENHIKVVLAASGRTVSPAFLADNLNEISRSFVPGQQQDAHEFLLFLLEGMQHCKTEGMDQNPSTEKNIVSELFMGQMKSQVKCKSCLHCSESVEPFLGLNLEIENCDSVQEGLSNFLAAEDLQEDNNVFCSNCKQEVRRSKQLSFVKSPQILIVQLKRYKASEFFPTKIERDITYGMSLDLAPYVSQVNSGAPIQDMDWDYSLYAVLVHSGWSTSSGHYYCFVQTSPGIWHCMNDSLVTRVSERTALLQEAYILFYIHKGSKEQLQLNSLQKIDDDFKEAETFQVQEPQAIAIPYPSSSPHTGGLGNDECLAVNLELKESSGLLGSSKEEQADVEPKDQVVCSQSKLPDISKPVSDKSEIFKENTLSTEILQPAQQLSDSKMTHSPSKGILYERREKHNPSTKMSSIQSSEKKLAQARMMSSSSPVKNPSVPIVGCNQVAFESFEDGSQHSYVRLLNKMPSSRRQALSSALSAQGAMKQSDLKSTNSKGKVKYVNNPLQARIGRATSKLLHKEEHQNNEGNSSKREKQWADDHEYLDSRKLQRVGGKRVLASFSSGVH